MNWRLAITLLLVAGALATGWSILSQGGKPSRPGIGGRSDYVLHQFEATSLGADGKESFTVRSPYLQETPGAKSMELTTPLFLIPDQQGKYWEVRGKTGWVSDDKTEIRLRQAVTIDSPRGQPDPVKLATEALSVFPRRNTAHSDVEVTVTQPGSILRGRGMDADLDAKRYQLHSNVKARYVPLSAR